MILYVFDIDGTLTDSVAQHLQSFVQALADVGISDIDTHWEGYLHHTDSWVFAEIFRNNFGRDPDPGERHDFMRRVNHRFQQITLTQPVVEISGALDFISRIEASQDCGFVFATGSLRPTAVQKIKQIGLHVPAELLLTASEYETREEIVLNAIAAARRYYRHDSFRKICALGDGRWDAITARNLGLDFIGIGSGEVAAKLKSVGARTILSDYLQPEQFGLPRPQAVSA